MFERWKNITKPEGIENAYVSNTGRVRYLNKRGQWKTTCGSPQNGKYLQVKLGRRKYCTHILVANQWCEKLCKKFTVVHHKDACRSNNHYKNLEFTTQLLNSSLRTSSTMCVMKQGLYFPKFIFDGVIFKAVEGFATAELAREKALKIRKKMYDSAYRNLIINERLAENKEKLSSNTDEDHPGICPQPSD
jgi:hypothetical protein